MLRVPISRDKTIYYRNGIWPKILRTGDFVRTPGNDALYRYWGVRRELPKELEGREILVFASGVPFIYELPGERYVFLARDGETVENPGSDFYLPYKVQQLENFGPISPDLWNMLCFFSKEALLEIPLVEGKNKTLWNRILEFAQKN